MVLSESRTAGYIVGDPQRRQRDRETERQRERERDRERERERDRETERHRDRETERQETERQRDRETERQRDRETERQRDRETERQRERERQREKERDRETQRQRGTETERQTDRRTKREFQWRLSMGDQCSRSDADTLSPTRPTPAASRCQPSQMSFRMIAIGQETEPNFWYEIAVKQTRLQKRATAALREVLFRLGTPLKRNMIRHRRT